MKEARSREHIYKVTRRGVTYYMTQKEYEHCDEYIDALEEEVAESKRRWGQKKAELAEKWK